MTSTDPIAALQVEVIALRRQARILAGVALLALVAAVFGLLRSGVERQTWQTKEARAIQVEAQEFRLLDPDGRLRGLWRCPPAGPSLTLLDESGRIALELRQAPGGGGGLLLTDAQGKVLFSQP
jgi:hypothetical protein